MGVPFIPLDSPPAKTMTTLSEDNRIVHGLWVGGRLSALERLCIRSFCAHGHEFHLYHYDELHNVPRVDGLRLMNGEEILPRRDLFAHKKYKGYSIFSDHFRWELLRQRGGWWMDMDSICLRPLDFPANIPVFGEETTVDVATGVLKFPRGHALASALADACANVDNFVPWDTPRRRMKKIRRRAMFWEDSRKRQSFGESGGPAAFTSALKYFGMRDAAAPPHIFYPVPCGWFPYLLDGTLSDMGALEPLLSRSYAVHFWNTFWGITGSDKDGDYPANSLYEILKRRYGEAKE